MIEDLDARLSRLQRIEAALDTADVQTLRDQVKELVRIQIADVRGKIEEADAL